MPLQGVKPKPAKRIGCPARIVVRQFARDPQKVQLLLYNDHSHDVDMTLRQLHPSMRECVRFGPGIHLLID